MEGAGLKTTDVASEASDPEAVELSIEAPSQNLLNEAAEFSDVNGQELEKTVEGKQVYIQPNDSGSESAEIEEEDMPEPTGPESPPETRIEHGRVHDEEPREDANDKDSINQEEIFRDEIKKTDVPVIDCSMAEEVEEKEDQNQNKVQSTPSALRRSSRAKQGGDTPSSVGRTTRSQINPDIIAKQKSFMHKYQIAVKSSMDSYVRSATSEPEFKSDFQANKRKWEEPTGNDSSPRTSPMQEKKSKRTNCSTPVIPKLSLANSSLEIQNKNDIRHDGFCWTCHLDGQVVECIECPRVYHQRCIQPPLATAEKWLCSECVAVRNAEKHSPIDSDQLPVMLSFAMERIKSVADSQPFFKPVDTEEFPHYTDYIVCPVDISQLEEKIAQKAYASTRAFLADFRWILHNCIIFNSVHSKLTSTARTLMKVCKHEMAEIDTCADCYIHAHTKRETWFLEPCRRPHLLLWAKLKGFPHWPAKAMKANKEGNVDVRFFGAHDRAWVPAKDCFLYSREMPIHLKNQRKANLATSIEEVDQHIRKLVERYGSFAYPPPRTSYDPQREDEQLQMLIPEYKVCEGARLSDSQTPDRGTDAEGESMQSDSEPGDIVDHDTSAAPSVQVEDREEDRKFLAMLELAPRSTVEAAAANCSAPASRSESPCANEAISHLSNGTKTNNKELKSSKSTSHNVNGVDSTLEAFDRSCTSTPILGNSGNEPSYCDVAKEDEKLLGDAQVQIKSEPFDEQDSGDGESARASNPIAISIDRVVGNYKPSPTPMRPRPEGVKVGAKSGAVTKQVSTNKMPGAKQLMPKVAPKSVAKVTPNRLLLPKTTSGTKPNVKSMPNNHRNVGEEDEDLDPAMYLDPTITITLINNDEKKSLNKKEKDVSGTGPISSSDLQALNALGENVSITVVPKRKVLQGTLNSARSKENEMGEQAMVIEVDPANLQKNRGPHTAKARKSFPKSRTAVPPNPPLTQKTHQKTSNPPMVSIPSRHLGTMDVARTGGTPASSSSARIPSITVRPVSQPSQPSIILQPGNSDATSASTVATAAKQPTSTSGGSSANSALALNSMQSVGPEAGFGAGGLLLTFNRTLPPFTAATPSSTASSTPAGLSRSDSGTIASQLSAKTLQIADMVRTTLETLLQEVSAAGNVEASLLQLQIELEKSRSLHQQELAEMKRTYETQLSAAEMDKQKALIDLRRQMEADKQRAIDEVKKKQWCAQCGQEAIFYCCWNTAYCDYPCQQSHWPKHMATCANANQNTEIEAADDSSASPIESPAKVVSSQKTACVRDDD